MTKFASFVAAAVFTVTALPANADTLNGVGGTWTTWQQMSTLVSASSGGPYWNNPSGDGSEYNIGWCLAGGGNCTIPNAPGNLPFFADGNSAINNMWFTTGGSSVTVSLKGVFTSQSSPASGIDYLGYYTLDPNTGNITSSTRLLNAGEPIATNVLFTVGPNTSYGFYLENVQGQGLSDETDYWFYMNSTKDQISNGTTPVASQHFAVFNDLNSLYLGIEDGIGVPDGDYNDLIVQVTSTPEPATTALAAIGLLAFAILFRAKLKSSS